MLDQWGKNDICLKTESSHWWVFLSVCCTHSFSKSPCLLISPSSSGQAVRFSLSPARGLHGLQFASEVAHVGLCLWLALICCAFYCRTDSAERSGAALRGPEPLWPSGPISPSRAAPRRHRIKTVQLHEAEMTRNVGQSCLSTLCVCVCVCSHALSAAWMLCANALKYKSKFVRK